MRRRLFVLVLLCCSGLSSILFAQDYQTGLAHYLQNEFAKAEGIFQNLSGRVRSDPERAQVYKMLGLSQYMQGKRLESADSFKQAKRFSPGLSIAPREVLDETVLDFFSSIEGPPVQQEQPSVREIKPKPEAAAEPKKAERATELLVLSNVIEAKVIVDGFYRGKVGDIIPIDPGLHNIEVYGSNYQNQVQTINVKKGSLNKTKVKLEKMLASDKEEPKKEELKKEEPKKEELKKEEAKKEEVKTDSKAAQAQDGKNSDDKKSAVHKKKRRKKPVAPPPPPPPPEDNQWANFIPFGVPQYFQDKTATGILFSVGQAAGIGFFTQRWLQANKVSDQTDATVTDRDAQEQTITDPTQRQAFADATDAYFADQTNQINTLRSQAYMGIGFFAVLWISSSIEAIVNPPTPVVHPQSPQNAVWKRTPELQWSMAPTYSPGKHKLSQGTFALNLRLQF